MNFFKPDDIELDECEVTYERKKYLVKQLNAKLEKEGTIVSGDGEVFSKYERRLLNMKRIYKALLINIEPIEKCNHMGKKLEKIEGFLPQHFKYAGCYKCECGAKVKPVSFEELE